MTHAVARSIDALTPAWHELEARTPVKLCVIENKRHYRAMVDFMNELIDEIGDRTTHSLIGMLDIVTSFVRDYEERNVEIPDPKPADVLRFLMHQHQLRQADLSELFGTQSNVSEVRAASATSMPGKLACLRSDSVFRPPSSCLSLRDS